MQHRLPTHLIDIDGKKRFSLSLTQKAGKKVRLTENLWRQAVEKTCRLPQLEALSHPAGGGGGGTAPAPRTVPTAARHRTVPPRRVYRRLMARRAAGLGRTGRTHGRGTTRRARRTDGRGTTRRARRHLPRGYCGRRGVSAKVLCKIQNLFGFYQCCGSGSGSVGSIYFCASRIRIHFSEIRIKLRILL
jgi:hypothetical protein